MRGNRPTDAQPGGDRLGERAEIDDALIIVRPQGTRWLTLEPQKAVWVILKNSDSRRLRDLENLPATFGWLGDAGRIMERRDRVEELDALALRSNGFDGFAKGARYEAVIIHRHVHDVALVGAENPEGSDIGRGLDENDIAGIAERPRHQIECHLRAGRDDDVVRVCSNPYLGRDVQDLLAQVDIALARSVLQRLRTLLAHDARGHVRHVIHRQGLHVGHPPGQGDDFRPTRHREQGANRRSGDVLGSLGVGVNPRVETGAGRGALIHSEAPVLAGGGGWGRSVHMREAT